MENIYGIDAKIVYFEWYTQEIFAIKIVTPEICQKAKPGQFVMIRGKDWRNNPLLNRPMSIAGINIELDQIELQILVTGQGTNLLSQLKVNDDVSVIGPLGNSFTLPKNNETVALVAGGIGIAPLIYLDNELQKKNQKRIFFYGAANESELMPAEFIPREIRYSTEDGSIGYKGDVIEILQEVILSEKIDRVYACGPTPMLVAVQMLLKKNQLPGQISIETEMACGYGICQGCIVRKSTNLNEYYLTCKDGPVFDVNTISLDI